jgi:hypothetical protein
VCFPLLRRGSAAEICMPFSTFYEIFFLPLAVAWAKVKTGLPKSGAEKW